MKLEEAVEILRKANIKLPYQVHRAVYDQQMGADGTAEVYMCKKCPGWTYKAPIPCLEVNCPKGHVADVMWSRKNSSLPK